VINIINTNKFKYFIKNTLKTISRFLNLFFFIAAILLISYLVVFKIHLISPFFQQLNFQFLLFSLITILIGQLIAGYVWHLIHNKFGRKINFKQNFHIFIFSMLGAILPGSIWGIANRITQYKKNKETEITIILSSSIESILISFGSLIIFSLTFSFVNDDLFLGNSFIWIILVFLFVILSTNPNIINKLTKFIARKQKYAPQEDNLEYSYKDLFFWLSLESIVSLLGSLGICFLLTAFLNINFSYYPLIIAAWTLTNALGNFLVWVPGTLLIRDGFFLLVLTTLVSNNEALVFTIIQRIWLSLIIVGNVIIIFIYEKLHKKFRTID